MRGGERLPKRDIGDGSIVWIQNVGVKDLFESANESSWVDFTWVRELEEWNVEQI